MMNQYLGITDEENVDINDFANFFIRLRPSALRKHGGFYIYLRAGEGIVVPPLYIIGQANAPATTNAPQDASSKSEMRVDVVETWL